VIQSLGHLAVDPELVKAIIRQSDRFPSHNGHNVGGWRSAERLTSWEPASAAMAVLRTKLEGAAFDAWAVVHRNGSYHDWHRHSGVPWLCSGVLYLTTGGGCTVFRAKERESRVQPIAGHAITFDPMIEHCSEPHYGDDPRVTIAFNVRRR
jgi:hypothetical protein